MVFDYFYGKQCEQYAFYRIPKLLVTEEEFWNVSAEAKLLYGLLLDRMELSAKNGWFDAQGRVYIIFTIEEIKKSLLHIYLDELGWYHHKSVLLLVFVLYKKDGFATSNFLLDETLSCNSLDAPRCFALMEHFLFCYLFHAVKHWHSYRF